MDSGFMTTHEAAKRLGCSTILVRKACASGRLTAIKMGRDWLVKQDHLFKAFTLKQPGRKPRR